MKKKTKKVQSEEGPVKSSPARGKATKALKAKPAKGEATGDSASKAALGETAPAAVLGKPEVKKIQAMLKSKTAEGVTLGLSLLEALGATRADYEAVFTEMVIKAILGGWVAESWGAVAKALVPHGTVSDLFQRLAEEKYLRRPGKTTKLRDFSGWACARAATARPAFLAAWGQATEPAKSFLDLVDIPAGSFTMGSPENEAGRSHNENQVQVRITKPFRMGRTVVTQRQWREVMGTEPWRYKGLNEGSCGDDFPAVYVSWDDAMLFCQTLTELERETGRLAATQSYRLPTEAEWEYACRAGTTTAYSFGHNPDLLGDYGWYDSNSDRTLPKVAEKKPNPLGLFDMHGNVWEWCDDWYDATLAGGDDPVGPAAGSNRVYRGGGWNGGASYCRSASRCDAPRDRYDGYGFRVGCCVEPSESSVTPDDGSAPALPGSARPSRAKRTTRSGSCVPDPRAVRPIGPASFRRLPGGDAHRHHPRQRCRGARRAGDADRDPTVQPDASVTSAGPGGRAGSRQST